MKEIINYFKTATWLPKSHYVCQAAKAKWEADLEAGRRAKAFEQRYHDAWTNWADGNDKGELGKVISEFNPSPF
jgi:hypothetical protein